MYKQAAAKRHMTLSAYVIAALEYPTAKTVYAIHDGRKLIEAARELNRTLNDHYNDPTLPIAKIKDLLDENMRRLDEYMFTGKYPVKTGTAPFDYVVPKTTTKESG